MWNLPRQEKRAIIAALDGVRARVRFSLDGTLGKQAVVEGTVHVNPSSQTTFTVQQDILQPNSKRSRYVVVIFRRVINVQAVTTIGGTVPAPPLMRRSGDRCQNCLGMYQPPERAGIPKHCGNCPCCRTSS